MAKRKKVKKVISGDMVTILVMVAVILSAVLFLVSRSASGDDTKHSNRTNNGFRGESDEVKKWWGITPTPTSALLLVTPTLTPATQIQIQMSGQSSTVVQPTESPAVTPVPTASLTTAPTPRPTESQTIFQTQPMTTPIVVQPEIKTIPIAGTSVISSPSVTSGRNRTGSGLILETVKKKIESIRGTMSAPTVTPTPLPAAKQEKTSPEIDLDKMKLKYQVREGQVVLMAEDENGRPIAVAESDMRRAEISALGKLEKKGVTLSMTNENRLALSNNGITAVTELPIMIDTESRSVVVDTVDGPKTVIMLPDKVLKNIIDLGIITGVDTSVIPRIEYTGGEVVYEFGGNKTYNVLGLYEITVPVVISVSAETGEVVSRNQPLLTRAVRLISI